MLLLLEEHAKEIGNRVNTINCDVLGNMTKPCKKLFLQNKYHTLYPNVFDCDVLLSLFNQGQHWTLLSMFPGEKRMVFLDSLLGGSASETAFLRCCNFLTCATDRKIDWLEWHFFVIPEEHIPQQLNFSDCGMFSVKWAEHIAFGIPLDFQQENIEDFRYSSILRLFSQKVEVDYQFCDISEAANQMESTPCMIKKITINLKVEMPEERKMQNGTDDVMMNPHSSNNYPLIDHSYAKMKDNAKSDSSRVKPSLPTEVAAILPSANNYNVKKMQRIGTECFTGSPKNAFIVSFTIANVTNKDEVLKWKKAFLELSNVRYNTRQGTKRKGKTVMFAQWYICQCKRKVLTKRQEEVKAHVHEQRSKAIGNINQDQKELHLLSNLRDKKTNCPSKMSIKLFTKRSINEMREVKLF